MSGFQLSTAIRPVLVAMALIAVLSGTAHCRAQDKSPGKPKIQRVTSRTALIQVQKATRYAIQKKVQAHIQQEQRALAAVDREIDAQLERIEAALQKQRGADAFLKDYQAKTETYQRARTTRERQAAFADIERFLTKHRDLIKATHTAARVDLQRIVSVAGRPLSSLHGPLKPVITRDGAIIWVSDDGIRGAPSGTRGVDQPEPFVPQPSDFCLSGGYSQTYNSYFPDNHPGANSSIDTAAGKIISDLHAVQGLSPLGDTLVNFIYLGEVVTVVPAGNTTLRVSADVTYSREWSIQGVGYTQAGGWLELDLVQLPQNYNSVDIGSSTSDETVTHELGLRWVVAGQDDIPPPDQPPSPLDVTLDITSQIPDSERDYLIFVGGFFRADATGLGASADVKTNVAIKQICVRAEP